MERHRNTCWDADGIDPQDPSLILPALASLRESIEFGLAGRAIGNAGVFVHVFERRKEPEFVSDRETAKCSDIVLPRKTVA